MKKIIIITGATGGLGQAITKQLDQEDYVLVLIGRNQSKLNTLKEQLKSDNYTHVVDMVDYQKITEFVKRVVDQYGHIDVLINCAGANTKRDQVSDINLEDFKNMMDINVYSHIHIIQQTLPYLIKSKGHIIEILSTTAKYDNRNISAYSASKGAMATISKTLLKEIKHKDVSITNVYPGGINTSFRSTEKPEYMSPASVAKAIINCMNMPKDAMIQEIILRPIIEDNF